MQSQDIRRSFEFWSDAAAELKPETRSFIGGEYRNALSGDTFQSIFPGNGRVIGNITSGDADDIDLAVQQARTTFDVGIWSETAPGHRKSVLIKLADLIDKHREELALLECLDVGKPITTAYEGDLPAVSQCIRWTAEAIDKVYDEIAPSDQNSLAMVMRQPLGVIGIVVPWNLPLLLASWKFAPALAMGNSVVLKPAEETSLTAIRVAALASEAGVPDGVFNVVTGLGAQAGKALGLHQQVDAIAFTGSTEVGKQFLQYSGQSNMKRVALECGGKSPNIVLHDCPDLDFAAKETASGIFRNQGEICNAGSRLILDERIEDEFMDKLLHYANDYQVGHPLDPNTTMGALISERHHARVCDYVTKGTREGAKLELGGNVPASAPEGGFYLNPTIFREVTNDHTLAREEIFGPVLSVIRASSAEEAVRIGNDSIYGLAGAVWTRDITKAHKVAQKLRAGIVWVNCYSGGSMATPFGGFKQSGFGRDKSLHAFNKYSDLKTVWVNLPGALER